MINRDYITIVTGMGRCGTSLVMKMLEHGGISPYLSSAPGYENIAIRDGIQKGNYGWTQGAIGHTVKILEPFRYRLPPKSVVECRVIWLDRDVNEQANSWLRYKIRRGQLKAPTTTMRAAKRWAEKWIKKEIRFLNDGQRKSLEHLERLGHPYWRTQLETFQKRPKFAVEFMDNFLDGGLDVKVMAACVLPKEQRGNVPA